MQDWFNVTYGLEHSLISDEPNQPDKLTYGEIRKPVIEALGFDSYDASVVKFKDDDLLQFVKKYYAPLIEEIRNPDLLPPTSLGQNFPNPA